MHHRATPPATLCTCRSGSMGFSGADFRVRPTIHYRSVCEISRRSFVSASFSGLPLVHSSWTNFDVCWQTRRVVLTLQVQREALGFPIDLRHVHVLSSFMPMIARIKALTMHNGEPDATQPDEAISPTRFASLGQTNQPCAIFAPWRWSRPSEKLKDTTLNTRGGRGEFRDNGERGLPVWGRCTQLHCEAASILFSLLTEIDYDEHTKTSMSTNCIPTASIPSGSSPQEVLKHVLPLCCFAYARFPTSSRDAARL